MKDKEFLANTLNRAVVGRKKNLEKLPEPVDDSKYVFFNTLLTSAKVRNKIPHRVWRPAGNRNKLYEPAIKAQAPTDLAKTLSFVLM